MFPIAVLIAAPELQAALRKRLSAEALDVLVFGDTEVLKALECITAKHPSLVVLERGFSTSARGIALVRRLKADATLEATTIQVETADEPLVLAAAEPVVAPAIAEAVAPAAATVAVAAPVAERAPTLDTGTRRAPRFQPDESLQVQVDGKRATVLDISTVGAKLLTSVAVRPNQRVRVSFADSAETIRCSATVVWASFEIPKDAGPQYRVGVDFVNADTTKLDVFIARHTRA